MLSALVMFLAAAGDPAAPLAPAAPRTVTVRVTRGEAERPVLPESFGVNGADGVDLALSRRHGGNRFTAFDWETGASNAGSDWLHHSDLSLLREPGQTGPADLLVDLVRGDHARGASTWLTLPLAGFVAADAAGTVHPHETAPSARWKRVLVRGDSPPSSQPDLDDSTVRLDELLLVLRARLGTEGIDGVQAFLLDNEPALWSHTHPRVHPEPARWAEVLERGVELARLVTELEPRAEVVGPVLYGWAALRDLQGASDASDHVTSWFDSTFGSGDSIETFGDYYLAGMRTASERAGRRLLHRFDLHWYPEAHGEQRVISDAVDAATMEERLQAPRSLWDPRWRERSWVADSLGGPVELIPRLQAMVDTHYPGTGLAISEYSFGAPGHVSGGLAQADALGVFARHGVAAHWWPMGERRHYAEAAFALYLEDDGFGDVSLPASSDDAATLSVHAARRSDEDGVTTLVLINKRFSTIRAEVALRGLAADASAREVLSVRGFDASSAELRDGIADVTVTDGGVVCELPGMSATLVVVRG